LKKQQKDIHRTRIGGQALMEGVMMRGVDKISMAVRLPSGDIDVETWGISPKFQTISKVPIIRGVFNMIDSLVLGYRCLMKSAEKSGMLELEEEPGRLEKKLTQWFGEKMMGVITITASVIGVALALLLFMYLPSLFTSLLSNVVELGLWKTVIEGIIKIAIFVGYLALVSMMSDMKRMFAYHGAEHKSIACYEAGEELSPENAQKYPRFHPRCGTSFLLIALIISIIIFSIPIVPWDNLLLRVVCKIVLLPVVVGLAYELIRLAGRHDNIVTHIISAPGLWLQRLSTKEPDLQQLEVAIASLKPVIPQNKEDDRW
jgi:uncharacterized protein YqhQ